MMTCVPKTLDRNCRYFPTLLTALLFGVAGSVPVLAAPPGYLPFGVYDPGGDFENDTNVQIEHLFLPWEDLYLQSLSEADTYALKRHRAVLVTIEPWTWSRSERNTPQHLREGIFDGSYDNNMRTICEVLNTLQSPVTVRWGHEMDDDNGQFIWAGWDAETYVAAYRRMIDVCRAAAPKVRYMWSPTGFEGMEAYYPGDDYADVVGISVFGYQPWDQDHYDRDRTFEDIMAPRYERAATFDKPVVVAELAYSGKQAYVDMWENAVRNVGDRYPQLVGVVYFNYPEVYNWPEGFGRPDWRVHHRVLE
jgi:endoglucanase